MNNSHGLIRGYSDAGFRFCLSFALLLWVMGLSLGLLQPVSSQSGSNFSLRFYGNGDNGIDRVEIPIDNPAVPADIGATDFTLEWWMKAQLSENSSAGAQCGQEAGWIYGNILFDRDIFDSGDYGDFGVSVTQGKIAFGVSRGTSGNTICGTINIADGVWHHVALTRSQANGTLRIYVDGRLDAQGSGPTGDVSYRDGRSTNYPKDPYLVIGAEKHDNNPDDFPSFSGWVDEVRLSKVIRYTSDFTLPTGPFVPDANTVALYHFDEGPAGPCSGKILDSSGATGGPSEGACKFGGNPAGPVYSSDTPFNMDQGTLFPNPSSTLSPTRTRTPTLTGTLSSTRTPTNTPTQIIPPPPAGDERIFIPLLLRSMDLIMIGLLILALGSLIFFSVRRWVSQHGAGNR